jgi:VIT1/CCC1 family predicted Fe2+/Mn2+ transporter
LRAAVLGANDGVLSTASLILGDSDKDKELEELTGIYVQRGLTPDLAKQVAVQLTAKDALAAHARDELGISDVTTARPLQAAFASAAAFSAGAAVPILASLIAPVSVVVATVYVSSLLVLAVLGALGARAGGAPLLPATLRVTFWGVVAMAVSAGIGLLFHVQI